MNSKLPPFPLALACLLAFLFQGPESSGQSLGTNTAPAQTLDDYSIVQQGPHSRVWQNGAGQSVTELTTGMNYWNGQHWVPSNPAFAVSADGNSFVASEIQDPTTLAANLNCAGAVQVTTPDNVSLKSTPIAIELYDAASGKSVVVATLTNVAGTLLDPQHVLYDHAFVGGGFAASVVYSLPDPGSFHQDVIFVGFNQGFDPTVWGFAADSTNSLQIQIVTEFFDVPQPAMLARPIYIEQDPTIRAGMASPDIVDYTLDWGDYVFWPGKIYSNLTNTTPSDPGVPVAKDFVTVSNRTFLIESVKYSWIKNQLAALPAVAQRDASPRFPKARKVGIAAASLPQLKPLAADASPKAKVMKTAALPTVLPRGVDLDYVAVVSSTTEPALFSSDTTYFVSGNVNLSSSVTMESAVFKFPTNAGIIYIEYNEPLIMNTTNYRPAIFTAADDDTVGTKLSTNIWSSYSGTIKNNSYGVTALWLYDQTNMTVHHAQFRYLWNGVAVGYSTTNPLITLADCQFVNGQNGFILEEGVTLSLNNCLFGNVQYPMQSLGDQATVNACNCTFDSADDLCYNWGASSFFTATNSIFSNITNEFVAATSNAISSNGAYNGFYKAASFGTSTATNTSSPYQTVGAGSYYLSSNSSFLAAGTANISASALTQLQMKTALAPLWLTNTITSNTTLTPIVARDTSGTALGFHFDPIDYLTSCTVSNATLLLTEGVSLGYFNEGIVLTNGSQLLSQGAPTSRNYIAYYAHVQEGGTNRWGTNSIVATALPIVPTGYPALPSSVSLFQTTISVPTGEIDLINTGTLDQLSQLSLRDCELYGSGASWTTFEVTTAIGLTNNVFYRIPFTIVDDTIYSFNNLFYGTTNIGSNTVTNTIWSGSPSPYLQNNVFDGVAMSLYGASSYNVYTHGGTNTGSLYAPYTNINDIWTNLTWQPGPLGAYYQPANSPLLTNGSTYAANLGLYHYTVGTNELVEGTNMVSRGYHYIDLDATGQPIDTNTNGLPDYVEDSNGDGVYDSGDLANSPLKNAVYLTEQN